jgi:hypothetical protein
VLLLFLLLPLQFLSLLLSLLLLLLVVVLCLLLPRALPLAPALPVVGKHQAAFQEARQCNRCDDLNIAVCVAGTPQLHLLQPQGTPNMMCATKHEHFGAC